jgi:hypothetical protein
MPACGPVTLATDDGPMPGYRARPDGPRLQGPWLGHFGDRDRGIPPGGPGCGNDGPYAGGRGRLGPREPRPVRPARGQAEAGGGHGNYGPLGHNIFRTDRGS